MSKKLIAFVILSSIILGGIGGWAFTRYVIPKINTISFLTRYNLVPTAGPVVIHTTEQVRVNEGSDSIATVQRATPWIVGILNNGNIGQLNYSGTGVVLTSDGLIATSKDALPTAPNAEIRITQRDGIVLPAEVVASDPSTNLVFLKAGGSNWPTAEFGVSRDLRLGQRIIALEQSFYENQPTGLVTYLSSEVHDNYNRIGFSDNITQTFTIGGVEGLAEGTLLVSLDGNAQGIYAGGSVITSDVIKAAMNNYFSNEEIVRPSFGFYYQHLSRAAANALGYPQGLMVRRLDNRTPAVSGPAFSAGLREGDIITHVNDREITDQDGFEDISINISPNQEVKLKVLRGVSINQANPSTGTEIDLVLKTTQKQ